MAVKIRLARQGAKKSPFYRIVVTSSESPRDGKFIEKIGTYDPKSEPYTLNVNEQRLSDWLQKGAKPTTTVKSLLEKRGLLKKGTSTLSG